MTLLTVNLKHLLTFCFSNVGTKIPLLLLIFLHYYKFINLGKLSGRKDHLVVASSLVIMYNQVSFHITWFFFSLHSLFCSSLMTEGVVAAVKVSTDTEEPVEIMLFDSVFETFTPLFPKLCTRNSFRGCHGSQLRFLYHNKIQWKKIYDFIMLSD